jgi:RNA polymerase sigma-54 factor
MAFELSQKLRLSQSLVMTPQLQQAIKLLQLNRIELTEVVTQEMMENPILEELGESGEGEVELPPDLARETEAIPGSEGGEVELPTQLDALDKPPTQDEPLVAPGSKDDDFNWESYMDDFNNSGPTAGSMREINEDLPSFENALTKTSSLEEHLHWQLSMMQLTPEEKTFSGLVVANLNDDGYLEGELATYAQEAGLELEDAEEVLKMIQHLDPIAIGSRSLQECLQIQARFLVPRQPLVDQILEKHMHELERRNYPAMVKALGVSMAEISKATHTIMEFEPKPARSFHTADTQYISPDIYIYKVGNEFMIVLNEDGMPRLRISPYYRNILAAASKKESSDAAQAGDTGPSQGDRKKMTKEYVQDKLRSAVWLIRSIHNRQKTIYKVTEAIVKRQRDFFDKGVQFLKPMILKDVASDIGMHESTISRVTTNKYVHTPVGIFELKYFFNSSINATDGGDSLASEAVKEKIKHLIAKEDPKSPISDQKIVEILKTDGIDIARRTVAKYRDLLGILSSAKRKQMI